MDAAMKLSIRQEAEALIAKRRPVSDKEHTMNTATQPGGSRPPATPHSGGAQLKPQAVVLVRDRREIPCGTVSGSSVSLWFEPHPIPTTSVHCASLDLELECFNITGMYSPLRSEVMLAQSPAKLMRLREIILRHLRANR